MGRLDGKVAIVTGAAQGLGRAYAHALAREGARVVIADINGEKGERVRDEIAASGGTALAITTDVADEASTMRMAEATLDAFGRIDVLVNNAGLLSTLKRKPFWEISVAEWDEVMAVNVRGIFLCCKAVADAMKRQRKGKIVNISSGVAFMGKPLFLHYVASKAAVLGLTRGLARELGPWNINVNSVTPGPILTEVARDTLDEEGVREIMATQAIKRLETPEDVVGTILFLSSDESDFITGQVFVINGGSYMR